MRTVTAADAARPQPRRGRTADGDHADDRGVATVWAATAVAALISVLAAMLDLAGGRRRPPSRRGRRGPGRARRGRAGGARWRGGLRPGGGRRRAAAAAGSCCAGCGAGRRSSRSRWACDCRCSARPRCAGRARAGPAAVGPPIPAPGERPSERPPCALITPSGRRSADERTDTEADATTRMRTGSPAVHATGHEPRVHR